MVPGGAVAFAFALFLSRGFIGAGTQGKNRDEEQCDGGHPAGRPKKRIRKRSVYAFHNLTKLVQLVSNSRKFYWSGL